MIFRFEGFENVNRALEAHLYFLQGEDLRRIKDILYENRNCRRSQEIVQMSSLGTKVQIT